MPVVFTLLVLTSTATPPTATASDWAFRSGLPIACSRSASTSERSTLLPIVAVRVVLSVAVARTAPMVPNPPEPPCASAEIALSLVGFDTTSSCVAVMTVLAPVADAVKVELSVENAWPPAADPPRLTATAVATVMEVILFCPSTSTVTRPASPTVSSAVTRDELIVAVTVLRTVVSVSDTPIDPPTKAPTRAPAPNVLSTRSLSTAVTATVWASTVLDSAISAVTMFVISTRPWPPEPAAPPPAFAITTVDATATPRDVTSASDVALTSTMLAAVTVEAFAAVPSLLPILAVTLSVIVFSTITAPTASPTPLPIPRNPAPAPASAVTTGLSMAESVTDPVLATGSPACTSADSTEAVTVFVIVL